MKIRTGFVSNSSSSSFVIGTAASCRRERPTPKGNAYKAWQWLKAVADFDVRGVWKNGDPVDFRYRHDEDCYKNDVVVEYMGCCEMCYGPFQEWNESEFIEEFKYDHFQFSQEQADKFNNKDDEG